MIAKFKILLWAVLLLPTLLSAQTWQAESGERQVALLELFTAEGCGLCPAADRWVHDLPNKGITSEQLIVLGFHIDYLNDKKGWVDRFASPVFSDRQRELVRLNLYQTVYTPEFILSGEVIHLWRKHMIDGVKAVNNFETEAKINLTVSEQNNQLIINSHIAVEGEENREYSKLYLAVVEDDLISKINGGDNRGATFNHQNLVRQWLGPFDLDKNGETDIVTTVDWNNDWDRNKARLVAVVQNMDDSYVLQALALNLDNN